MKNLYIKIKVKIEDILGICNTKGCYKKAKADIYFKQLNIKRCLCDKHLIELQNMDLVNSIKE